MMKNVPPHSIEAEEFVIGSCLMRPAIIEEVAGLISADDFYDQRLGKIFAAIMALSRQSAPVDLVSVSETLGALGDLDAVGGPARLGSLAEAVALPVHGPNAARAVRDRAQRRAILRLAESLVLGAQDQGAELGALALGAQRKLDLALEDRSLSTSRSAGDLAMDWVASLERLQEDGGAGIRTPFHKLNGLVTGLVPGEVFVVAGRPGGGKTALALNLALHAAEQGYGVGVFSMEMQSVLLMNRLCAAGGEHAVCGGGLVDAQRFRDGKFSRADWQAIYEFAERARELPLYFSDKPSIRPSEMRAQVRRWSRMGVRVVAVDYLQLITPENRGGSRERELAEASRLLKNTAVECGVSLILLSQLNRESEKAKRPLLSHLRESGAIEQDADIILFIVPWKTKGMDAQGDNVEVELDVAKGRNNTVGSFRLVYRKKYLRFENVPYEKKGG